MKECTPNIHCCHNHNSNNNNDNDNDDDGDGDDKFWERKRYLCIYLYVIIHKGFPSL